MSVTYDQVLEELTAPGAPFELGIEMLGGRELRCFTKRERSMREKIANAAGRGEAIAFVQGERRVSYGEFARLVWGFSRALTRDHDFQRGDRLAILAYNCPEWPIAAFGATSVGGVGVALNGWWQTDELNYALRDSGSRYLVVDERLYPRVAPLIEDLPDLERVFFIGKNAPPETIPVEHLLEPCDEIPNTSIEETDPFMILYTSGTTGRSKGCITTHTGTIQQVLEILFATTASSRLKNAPVLPKGGDPPSALVSSPLFHVGGFHSGICTQITVGSKIVFLEGKFEPEKAMQVIEDERIVAWPAIPTMLHRVVHHPRLGDYDLSSLRTVSFGGAPTSPETIDKAREVLPIKPSMTNAYGLTETHGVATVNSGGDLLGRKTAAGRVAPILDCRILLEDGGEAETGRLGEILFRGPTITPGYWNRPEATAETVRDGWLHTGDLGYLDEEGFLFIVDRAKDMILRGGENVYCAEIEHVIADHPAVDEAAVIGRPDPELGERVMAVVKLRGSEVLSEDDLTAHVMKSLARFKVPEFVVFVDDPLPRNPSGKLLKNEMRERYVDSS